MKVSTTDETLLAMPDPGPSVYAVTFVRSELNTARRMILTPAGRQLPHSCSNMTPDDFSSGEFR